MPSTSSIFFVVVKVH